jgi:putative N6-adenine-specific DNA methylase
VATEHVARQTPRPKRAGTRTDQQSQRFFAPCPRGLEAELAKELNELGVADTAPASGGVAFAGDLKLAWRVNLWSRLAVRVLQQVAHGRYRGEDDLYEAALALPWPAWFGPQRTLAVHAVAHRSPLKSLNFASLRIKDAVCDRFRADCGERPSVDTRSPDVPLLLYLDRDAYTLYLDLTGAPLNRRGFRREAAAAPLNENLAAGILRLAGWHPDIPLLDPMMGGGTLLIEAAMLALNIAPGLKRHFAFEHLTSFDRVEWARLRKDAQAAALPARALPIYGCDLDPAMLAATEVNLRAAGLLDCVRVKQADALTVAAPAASGILVSNPPYGVRLAQPEPAAFYRALGNALKQRFTGWTAWLLSADPELPRRIGLKASRRIPLYNGPLECRLYEYRMVAGRPD